MTAALTPTLRRRLTPGFRNQPPTFKAFVVANWPDILTQLSCILTAYLIYAFCPLIMPRYFALYDGVRQSSWGIAHGKPLITEYIDTNVSAATSFAIPFLIMGAIGLWHTRDFVDTHAALTGLGYALSTSTLLITLIKVFVGGLRPHFLAVCSPWLPENALRLPPGINGGYYYHAQDICQGPQNRPALREAQLSFPSGHACAAFAGFGYLAIWLNSRYRVLSGPENVLKVDRHTFHWKLVAMTMAPLCVAVLVAASKVRDMWHHPVDVVAGAAIGAAFAYMGYRTVYTSGHIARGAADTQIKEE